MKLVEATDLASRNLLETYLALGKAVHGTKHYEASAYDACVGPLAHPICNFGISGFWTEAAIRNIRGIENVMPPFNLYALPSERPLHLFLPWQELGFELTYSLCCMRSEPLLAPPARVLVEARTNVERQSIADFMAMQFFPFHAPEARAGVSAATANAEGLQLHHVVERGHTKAAVMLHPTEKCLGLYNLCVESRTRGKGLGRAVVDWVLAKAAKQGLTVTLQCDPKLAPWYQQMGFSPYGNLEVYTLAKKATTDIMGASVGDA